MDVISSAALNQYLITHTEERLECVSVCVCERRRERERQVIGMKVFGVTPSNVTCVIALVRLLDFQNLFLLLVAVTLILHQIFHMVPTDQYRVTVCVKECVSVCVCKTS